MRPELSDTFGNYALHGIDEIILPPPVSWWPLSAPGWQILAALLLCAAAFYTVRAIRRYRRNRYRREILQMIEARRKQSQQAVLHYLPEALKLAALAAFPRHAVAQLSGEAWLDFLEQHCAALTFNDAIGRLLCVIDYQPPAAWQFSDAEAEALIARCCRWIREHEAADV